MYIVDKAEISILTFICTQYITLWLSTLKLPQYFDKSFLLYWFISISFTLHLKIFHIFFILENFSDVLIYTRRKKSGSYIHYECSTIIYTYICIYVGWCLCVRWKKTWQKDNGNVSMYKYRHDTLSNVINSPCGVVHFMVIFSYEFKYAFVTYAGHITFAESKDSIQRFCDFFRFFFFIRNYIVVSGNRESDSSTIPVPENWNFRASIHLKIPSFVTHSETTHTHTHSALTMQHIPQFILTFFKGDEMV